MTSTQLNLITPLEAPLPPAREGEVFTDSQWTTLMAIADTIIPSIHVSSTPLLDSLAVPPSQYTTAIEVVKTRVPPNAEGNLLTEYFQENASSIPAFRLLLQRMVTDYLREEARKGIRVILSALE